MSADDVRLSLLTRNLRALASSAAASSAADQARVDAAARAARHGGGSVRAPNDGSSARPRAAVVCWDMGHNPVGRGYVLYRLLEQDYDVELIGPLWSRFGTELWQPLRSAGLNVRTFACDTLDDFVPRAEALAAMHRYDLVVVCKPRLPSMFLGGLLQRASACPLVLDIDDLELSFFDDDSDASRDELDETLGDALREPYQHLATRYAQSQIGDIAAITVSNVALQQRFGGYRLRHARDGDRFANSAQRRAAGRARLGIQDDEFALVFVGTPRPHKGVLEVARALHELDDPSIVFHIVGDIVDEALPEQLRGFSRARVVCHRSCAFYELPEFIAAADLVPLIQSAEHPVSDFQIPAKISDALALGVPVLATNVAPLADLVAGGAVQATTVETLVDDIARLRAQPAQPSRWRSHFDVEFGLSVNRVRLDHAIRTAQAAGTEQAEQGVFALDAVIDTVRDAWARRREPVEPSAMAETSRRPLAPRLPRTLTGRDQGHDVALFWKQNDSGLYGRRSDMIARYLARASGVRRVVQFDAPVPVASLQQQIDAASGDQQHLLLQNLLARRLNLADEESLLCRTCVTSPEPDGRAFAGERLIAPESYVRWVREQLEQAGMRPENTIGWFCPVVPQATELIDTLGFRAVVSDLIDDQRAWDIDDTYRARLDAAYRRTLGASDAVFANCEPLADAMSEYADDIVVVPNGAERQLRAATATRPPSLAGVEGPVAGYVGNLRDRIDWVLLHDVVQAMPDVSFVFYGPAGDSENARNLAMHANVHLAGIVPYAQLPAALAGFDVGLLPHLDNRLTARMNPLKVYSYFASGLPIVSCEVGNLADLGGALVSARDSDAFVAAIRAAIAAPPDTSAPEWIATMDGIAWDARVAAMLSHLETRLSPPHRRVA